MTSPLPLSVDVVVVGGGPAGATAAWDLARQGRSVLMLERGARIKPCGGAVPPKLLEEFEIPESLLVARITSARICAPSDAHVDMPIDGGYVGMVDRETFDEWLRQRAVAAGAICVQAEFRELQRDAAGNLSVTFAPLGNRSSGSGRASAISEVRTDMVIGADGARSEVARQCIPGAAAMRYVAAYHEIIESPEPAAAIAYLASRCDVYYQGRLSPDFYGWVFPHGDRISVGVGSAVRGFSLRHAVAELREQSGLCSATTVRREGAPIPLKPLPRWDNGRDVVLAGDAAGVVAPASGEGIYYAMAGGRYAAAAVAEALATGHASALAQARRKFMRAHGRVFWILRMMQSFWYSSDRRRERFVHMCGDRDVQRLTWQAYMYKRLVRASPLAHLRIFFKDTAHLLGLARLSQSAMTPERATDEVFHV
jgi:geranylgeranyl reductase